MTGEHGFERTQMHMDAQKNRWRWSKTDAKWILEKPGPGVTNPAPPKDPPPPEPEDRDPFKDDPFTYRLTDIIQKLRGPRHS